MAQQTILPTRSQLQSRHSDGVLHLTGVVGHRDLRDEDDTTLREEVDWYLEHQPKRWPKGVIKSHLINGLAMGADQLVATQALQPKVRDSYRQILAFPCSRKDYIEVIEKESGGLKDEVKSLFTSPSNVETIELDGKANSNEGFEKIAHWMADTCDVLLVLWNGNHNGLPGGTSETVAYALSETCAAARRASGLDPIVIHHLVTPRESNVYPAGEAYAWHEYKGLRTKDQRRSRLFRWLGDRINVLVTMLVLAATTIGFGYHGFKQQDPKLTVEEVFFDTVGFLTLNNLNLQNPDTDDGSKECHCLTASPEQPKVKVLPNLWLKLSRGSGVAFFLFTVLAIVYQLIDRMRVLLVNRQFLPKCLRNCRFALNWFQYPPPLAKSHAIVCGAGWQGRRIIEELVYRENKRVVVIEEKVDEDFEFWCRTHNIGLVQGDAAEPGNLKRAGIATAGSLYAFCGEKDDLNIRIVSAASARCRDGANATVGLNSKRGFEVLKSSFEHPVRLHADMLNVDAVTVRMLLERYPFDRFQMHSDELADETRVLILGDTSVAKEILRQIIQLAHFEVNKEGLPLRKARVGIAVPDVAAFMKAFVAFYPAYKVEVDSRLVAVDPWVTNAGVLPVIEVMSLPTSTRGFLDPANGISRFLIASKAPCSIYAAIDQGNGSVNAIRSLAAWWNIHDANREIDMAMFVYVNERDNAYRHRVMRNINVAGLCVPVVVYGDFLGEAGPTTMAAEPSEKLARQINALHNLQGEVSVWLHDEAAILGAWKGSTEDDKDSSRQAAAFVPVLVRIMQRLQHRTSAALSEIEEQLARAEHNRWCAEKLLKGHVQWDEVAKLSAGQLRGLESQQLLAKWNDDGGKLKKKLKAAYQHIDLLAYNDLPVHEGKNERDKDLKQIRFAVPKGSDKEKQWLRRGLRCLL